MLPDLWRMAHRHVRPAPRAVEATGSPRLHEVLAGVSHHGRADTAFHASAVFREGERAMAGALATVAARRLSLFAHVTWELCLDGALVRREGPAIAAGIRRGLAEALEASGRASDGETAALGAARVHHHARKGEALPAGFESRVDHMLRELGRGPWIEGYARGAIVAERLEGIRTRLGFDALAPDARATLAALLDGAIEQADEVLDPLLALAI